MKLICLFLYFVMQSHNLAQQTINPKQQGTCEDILREIKENSKTFGLYLEKMNSMDERIKSMERQCTVEPCNCLDLKRKGFNRSGVYTISVHTHYNYCITKQIQVYCDMETDGGGWLVFQRRTDGSENFYRRWNDYKNGFGDLTNEFWLGNENLYQILNTCGNQYDLRVDLGDFSNETRFAKYSSFNIESEEDKYRLRIEGYSGDAGDSMTQHQNGQQFSAFDEDNDRSGGHCADLYKGGWWYGSCHKSNLNGLYLKGNHTSYANGVNWYHWKGYYYSLRFTEMKIRPK